MQKTFFFKKKLFFSFSEKKQTLWKNKKTTPLAKTKHKTIAKTSIHRTLCNKTQNPFQKKKNKAPGKKNTQNV